MATELMSPQPESRVDSPLSNDSPPPPGRKQPTVREIIDSARRTPKRMPSRGAWLLGALGGAMLWASFTPLDWGPLAWLAVVPFCLLIRIPQRTRWMYSAIYLTALLQASALFQWMRLGDTWMYPAWISFSLYLAVYMPVFVAVSRTAVHRFRVPLIVTVPTVWVGLEFVRAHLLTGAAWYFLGHTQYRWLELIQISDVVGAYGVSFLVAMISACLAGLVPVSFLKRLRLQPAGEETDARSNAASHRRPIISVAVSLTIFAAVLGYGYLRRSQADFQPGPRIALIQGNFTTSLKHDPLQASKIHTTHRTLTGMAVRHQPDLIVWPETMYRSPLIVLDANVSDKEITEQTSWSPKFARDYSTAVPRALARLSRETDAALMIGVDCLEIGTADRRRHNSAAFITPERGLTARYDKMHLVVFGEYVPFKKQFPQLTKSLPDPGVDAGKSAAVMNYKKWRFTPLICFEDSVPHLVRKIVRSIKKNDKENRSPDVLVNLTNDGWFHGSSELDQHLITAVFRSVECRTPMVRAVNTGISAVIDGDGAVIEPEVFIDADNQGRDSMRDPKTGRWNKSLNAVLVHNVPLDHRSSLYVEWGDWFAWLCSTFIVVVLAGSMIFRRRNRETGRELFIKSIAGK